MRPHFTRQTDHCKAKASFPSRRALGAIAYARISRTTRAGFTTVNRSRKPFFKTNNSS